MAKEKKPRKLKCQVCLEYSEKTEMIKESAGYLHILKCHNIYLEEKRLAKQRLCVWCDTKDDVENLIDVTLEHAHSADKRDGAGKLIHSKGDVYTSEVKVHLNCKYEFLADKKFKQEEAKKKKELSIKIAEVYGLQHYLEVPESLYPFIEDLRNDSKLFGKLGKNYKQGIPYDGIALTYEYCKEKIREAHRTKEFKNFMMELRYGLAIVRNNLVDCKNEFEMLRRQEKSLEIKKTLEFVAIETEENTMKYVKNEEEDDISDLLD